MLRISAGRTVYQDRGLGGVSAEGDLHDRDPACLQGVRKRHGIRSAAEGDDRDHFHRLNLLKHSRGVGFVRGARLLRGRCAAHTTMLGFLRPAHGFPSERSAAAARAKRGAHCGDRVDTGLQRVGDALRRVSEVRPDPRDPLHGRCHPDKSTLAAEKHHNVSPTEFNTQHTLDRR